MKIANHKKHTATTGQPPQEAAGPQSDPVKSSPGVQTTASGIPVKCAHDQVVDITTLVPNPKNPNTHPEQQIAMLAKIIRAQGWRSPIVVSNRSGFVTKGHGRLAAAQVLQVQSVPVDFQDYTSEAEEWSDMIADNKISELAELDFAAVSALLKELDADHLQLTGFPQHEIENLLAANWQPPEQEPLPGLPEDADALTITITEDTRIVLNTAKKKLKLDTDDEAINRLATSAILPQV